MFNEERKLSWINGLEMKESTIKMMYTYMNRIGKYEEQLGKDCCEFTKEEILSFYSDYNASSVNSISNMNSKYKAYTEWCYEHGYTKENVFAELTLFDWQECCDKGSPAITREELLHLFHGQTGKITNPSDQFLCLALFEGICGPKMCELIHLTMDDFEGDIVHLNTGRTLKVSKELLRIAAESASTYEKDTAGYARPTRKLKDEPNILKGSHNEYACNDETRMANLRASLALCKSLTGVSAINQLSLIESGRIHMAKQFMKDQGHSSWEDAFKSNIKEINYRYLPALDTSRLKQYYRKYGDFIAREEV